MLKIIDLTQEYRTGAKALKGVSFWRAYRQKKSRLESRSHSSYSDNSCVNGIGA